MALKQTLGVGASTCSYRDWYGTDLLVFVGSDVPNNQPVTTKYIYEAKQRGTQVLVINPYREPGLERYWVPSALESALFGTRLTDRFFQIATGGDIGFLNGVLKHLLAEGWVDQAFLRAHTSGFEALKEAIDGQPWELLERTSGTTREEMLEFARRYARARTAVFVWSMGLTQHRFGVDNVTALVNLALARGMVGRERCGLMPIRGHSGVQGSAEMGAVPNALPGGVPLDGAAGERFARLWGFAPPLREGPDRGGGHRRRPRGGHRRPLRHGGQLPGDPPGAEVRPAGPGARPPAGAPGPGADPPDAAGSPRRWTGRWCCSRRRRATSSAGAGRRPPPSGGSTSARRSPGAGWARPAPSGRS